MTRRAAQRDKGRDMSAPATQLSDLSSTRLIPVTAWSDFHPWPPIGGLRHLIFNANSNGFHAVVRRCGRRVLIDEAAFFAWVEKQGGRHD